MKRIIILLGVLATISLLVFVTASINYSKGYRAGTIMKLSYKGVLFKTYEGQLNTGGGFNESGDITSSIWNFSVRKKEQRVLDDIQNAVDNNYRVKLYYREKYLKLPFWGDTKYFIYKVEKVLH